MSGGARAAQLAAEFEAAAGEVVSFARACPEATWGTATGSEGWSVGAVLNHIADGHAGIRRWMQDYLDGHPAQGLDQVNTTNATRSKANAARGRDETIQRLERNAEAALGLIANLSDEQLEIAFPFGTMPEMTLAGLARMAATHASRHLASAQAASGISSD